MRAVSLVQESLIDVLNRRFVSCHFNAVPAVGYDEDAAALAEKIKASGKSLQYGGILTPDGELVVSFGLDRDGFHRALKTSLEKHPEYAGMSDDEERIIQRANERPGDLDAQFDAIELYAEILQFGKANRLLDRVNPSVDRRTEIAERIDRALKDLPEVVIPPRPANKRNTYQLYIVRAKRRDGLVKHLAEQGVETKVHYPIPLHLQKPGRALGYDEGDFPVAEAQAREIVTLPTHQFLSNEEVDYMVESLRSFYRG